MVKKSEYETAAEAFLARHNITFSQEFVGKDCPRFCEDALKRIDMDKLSTFPRKTHIHGYHYRCTFTKPARKPLVVDFWNSYNDEEFNAWKFTGPSVVLAGAGQQRDYPYWDKFKQQRNSPRQVPNPYDVLACTEKSDPGAFEEFCGNFGYDSDSRRAEATWNAVREQWRDFERFFTPEELTEAQEIN